MSSIRSLHLARHSHRGMRHESMHLRSLVPAQRHLRPQSFPTEQSHGKVRGISRSQRPFGVDSGSKQQQSVWLLPGRIHAVLPTRQWRAGSAGRCAGRAQHPDSIATLSRSVLQRLYIVSGNIIQPIDLRMPLWHPRDSSSCREHPERLPKTSC
jgi:hypothetical protein